jgi:hypothetical protein
MSRGARKLDKLYWNDDAGFLLTACWLVVGNDGWMSRFLAYGCVF